MGSAGTVHNILGIEVDAKCLVESEGEEVGADDAVYEINGHKVTSDGSIYDDGLCSGILDKDFSVYILGDSTSMGSRHFDGKALVGYRIASDFYTHHAVKLPPADEWNNRKPELVEEIKNKLGLSIKEEDVGVFLMFDFINGMF